MKPRAEIFSYWTFETDLAKEMQQWPEYVSGSGYSVDLNSPTTGECVEVRLTEGDEDRWITVSSSSPGALFERVLGRVTMAMAKNSEISVIAIDKDA